MHLKWVNMVCKLYLNKQVFKSPQRGICSVVLFQAMKLEGEEGAADFWIQMPAAPQTCPSPYLAPSLLWAASCLEEGGPRSLLRALAPLMSDNKAGSAEPAVSRSPLEGCRGAGENSVLRTAPRDIFCCAETPDTT